MVLQAELLPSQKKDEGSFYSYSWTGYFCPSEIGEYKFETSSDDASHVLISGETIVDNGGFHATVTKDGTYFNDDTFCKPISILFGESDGEGSNMALKFQKPSRDFWETSFESIFFTEALKDLSHFSVTSGSEYCTIDNSGCITDGPGDYGNNEECTIEITVDGFLRVIWFDLESDYDVLQVNEAQFSGSGEALDRLYVHAGDQIRFSTDSGTTESGFTICLEPASFSITSGSEFCSVDEIPGCITDGEGVYGSNEECTIEITADGTLQVETFSLESEYDFLYVNDEQFTGFGEGLDDLNVHVGDTIRFSTDNAVEKEGFVICLAIDDNDGDCSDYLWTQAGVDYTGIREDDLAHVRGNSAAGDPVSQRQERQIINGGALQQLLGRGLIECN